MYVFTVSVKMLFVCFYKKMWQEFFQGVFMRHAGIIDLF